MAEPRDRNDSHQADPNHAATDPRAAARQDQVRADHAALEESARRIQSSTDRGATDSSAAARDSQRRADHDALERSAQRVAASVPADVRDTPVQPLDAARADRDANEAHENAEALRQSARDIQDQESRNRR
jgi:hypothetical protein